MLSRFSDLVDGRCEGSLGDKQLAPLTTLHPLDPILKTLDHLPQKTPKNSNQFLFFSATSSKSPFPHHRLCTCGSVTCISHRRYRLLSTHSARHPFQKGRGSFAGKRIGVLVSLPANRVDSNPHLVLAKGNSKCLSISRSIEQNLENTPRICQNLHPMPLRMRVLPHVV
jgi:hypothetical protein